MTRVTVIAEAGVNHNGNLALALELVERASDAGADIVKFQTFSADRLATGTVAKAEYQIDSARPLESQREMLKRLELNREAHEVLLARCLELGIRFLSTGFDIESINLLQSLGVDLVKIPSGELTNLPMLRHVAGLKRPVILSTGMAELTEVDAAVRALESGGLPRSELTVLQCTSAYPAKMSEVNLRAMCAMRDEFGVQVGLSDHTLGVEVAIAAVALGAVIIEKHFTLDRQMSGPDHGASLEPWELAHMIGSIRNVEDALGSPTKTPQPSEYVMRGISRKSIVASVPIRRGERLTEANLATKRPGTGISPMRWDEVIGGWAKRDFEIDEVLEL